ncbi:hypothetical protein GCM10022381_25390 [Leifsonia kafniensis]|uniref:VOC domain-containing protein n=1 Tax=Leifsonia kafniensis TaxID=475957 RepID=A0ABP7KME6_9MICO
MPVTSVLVSFNVPSPLETGRFFTEHLDFEPVMWEESGAVVAEPTTGFNLVFIGAGESPVSPQPHPQDLVAGSIVYLTLETTKNVDAEHDRLMTRAVPVTTPLQDFDGTRMFQVTAPGGIVVEFSAFE